MNQVIWSVVAPSGRSLRDHIEDPNLTDPPSLHNLVIGMGGGPVRTSAALGPFFDQCDVGWSHDPGLEDGVAVIGPQRQMLRVTGLYAG